MTAEPDRFVTDRQISNFDKKNSCKKCLHELTWHIWFLYWRLLSTLPVDHKIRLPWFVIKNRNTKMFASRTDRINLKVCTFLNTFMIFIRRFPNWQIYSSTLGSCVSWLTHQVEKVSSQSLFMIILANKKCHGRTFFIVTDGHQMLTSEATSKLI